MLRLFRAFVLRSLQVILLIGAVCCYGQPEPFTTYQRDDAARQVSIRIEVRRIHAGRQTSFALPPTLFGLFTENIWDAVYGGVWAQLLHNPSFEPDYLSVQNTLDAARSGRLVTDPSFGSGYVRLEPLADEAGGRFVRSSGLGLPLPWEPLRPAGVRYELRDGDRANSNRSLLLMGLPDREIGIRQGLYLPTHRTRRFTGSFWARLPDSTAHAEPVPLRLSLRRRDWADAVLAQTRVPVRSGHWTRYPFALDLPTDSVAPLERVDFVLSLDGEQRVLLDNVLCWPADHLDGFDPEVIAAARRLKTPLLRFGGNFVSGYHWQDGVGDPEKRRTLLNQAWGLPEYNHFGTDEFVRLCRLIGAEPQIAVNAGSGEPAEAAAWVEYCNGPPTTPYGAMRARNGHPGPYGIKFWEVGNELWGDFQIGWQTPASNARRYLAFAQAMHHADSTIRLIATGADIDFYQDWNSVLIEQAGTKLDLISTHLVIGMQPGEQRRAGADKVFTHAADLAVPVGVGRKLDEMHRQLAQDSRTAGRTKLAFTEWQFWSPRAEDPRFTNLGGAVNSAAFFMMLARRADFVPLSNMSNLVHFAGIHRQRGQLFVTPSYHVLSLYGQAVGSHLLAVAVRTPMYDVREGNRRIPDIADVPFVDALATLSPDGRTLRLYVVNRNLNTDYPVLFELEGFKPRSPGHVQLLTADGLAAANTPEHPAAVGPTSSLLATGSQTVRYVLPKHSVCLIELQRR